MSSNSHSKTPGAFGLSPGQRKLRAARKEIEAEKRNDHIGFFARLLRGKVTQ